MQTLLTPAIDLARQRFGGRGPQALLCGNAGHTDIPLDSPGSGLMALLMSMLGQTVGFPVPQGGAGELTRSLARRLESKGGEVRCGVAVERVDVRDGRVRGVHTADGFVGAERAVVAAVTAVQLYGAAQLGHDEGLLHTDDVPARVRKGMRQFTLDPSTFKVDWALNGPIPWASPPPHAPGTIHVADDVPDMAGALGQVSAGLVPAKPFMLAGQMTTSDATRSPEGTESFWAYTHVPQECSGDAGDEGLTGTWDHDECERFADRMQARFEVLAPGFGDRILARRILGPRGAGVTGRQPRGGRDQRRNLPAAPGAGVPSRGRAGSGRDRRPGALPRVGLGASRWWRPRSRRQQRRPRRAGARPRPPVRARPALRPVLSGHLARLLGEPR